MLSRQEIRRLVSLPGSLSRYGLTIHEVGLDTRGRNTRAAELAHVTPRTIRRAAQALREAEIRMPAARPGRPPRTDYTTSRRGYRRARGMPRERLEPVERAARAVAPTPSDVRQCAVLIRWICDLWPPEHGASPSPDEAAAALRLYFDNGGRLGPEADAWWRGVVQTLPLQHAHTPWRAAAAERHLKPWLAQRRARERQEQNEARRLAREERYDERARAEQPTAEELEAMRRRVRGRGRGS